MTWSFRLLGLAALVAAFWLEVSWFIIAPLAAVLLLDAAVALGRVVLSQEQDDHA